MAKFLLRIEARKLRENGLSIKKIAKQLDISKGTASRWVRDVILSVQLLEQLRNNQLAGAERGRLKTKLLNQEKRLKIRQKAKEFGVLMLKDITDRELLVAGLGLYWGEGCKADGNRRVEFCNSDPKMVKFLITWLKKCLGISKEDLVCNVGINEIHSQREKLVKEYWSKISGIPLGQFRKTSLKRVSNKKVYKNFDQHFGTFTVRVNKSTNLYYKIIGLIEGLYLNLPT